MTYDPFSIVVVPFPFTDSSKSKKRPALVISSKQYQIETGHITLAMITSASHTKWYGDYEIQNLESAGLSKDSIVRQKIFTIDIRFVINKIGALWASDKQQFILNFKKHIHLG